MSIVFLLHQARQTAGFKSWADLARFTGKTFNRPQDAIGNIAKGKAEMIHIRLVDWVLEQTLCSEDVEARFQAVLVDGGLNERQRQAMLATFNELREANEAAFAAHNAAASPTHSAGAGQSSPPSKGARPPAPAPEDTAPSSVPSHDQSSLAPETDEEYIEAVRRSARPGEIARPRSGARSKPAPKVETPRPRDADPGTPARTPGQPGHASPKKRRKK